MSEVTIQPVQSRGRRRQFLRLPWKLYAGDPNWVPPLRQHAEQLLGFRKHPFYLDAASQAFLATRGGEPVGRILAIVNRAHNRLHGDKRGFFGFFETIDDPAVAHGLLNAAADWLRQRGMEQVRGPMNPSLNYESALLIEGFDLPPNFMMTYNPAYYPPLLESWGLAKAQDLYAYWGHIGMLESVDPKLRKMIDAGTERFGIELRLMDQSRFREEVELFLDIYNLSFAGSWGFVPMSKPEIEHLAASLKHLIVPEMAVVAEVEGKPIGAAFCLLDYNVRIREIDGRLYPFGFLKLLRNRKQIKRIRVMSANVLPEYQRWGVGLLVLSGLLPLTGAWGIEEAEFSWIMESNRLSWGSLERGGAKRTKTYRIYDKDL